MGVNYNSTIITDGLVLCIDAANPRSYPNSGTTVYDLSLNKLTGTLRNGVLFASSNGGCFRFDGNNDYISIPYTSALTPSSEITFECFASASWSLITDDRRLISKTETGGYQIGINEGGYIQTGYIGTVIRAGGTYRFCRYPISSIPDGWRLFSFTFNGRYIKMYLDGILVSTTDIGSTQIINYTVNNPFFIGAEAAGDSTPFGNYFNGIISKVSVYNRALSDSEIQKNYTALRGRYGL